jgi:hypothetical protein
MPAQARFVSAYKRLIGGNKRESCQTLCLFPSILAYVVSRFRDLFRPVIGSNPETLTRRADGCTYALFLFFTNE